MQLSKRIIVILIAALLVVSPASAQITLSGNDYLSKPAAIITETIKAEGVTIPGQVALLSSVDRITTYKYLDGFGRPLQDIAVKASPNNKDLIQIYKYDEFGRQTKNYLLFEHTSVSGQPYQDRPTAISNQASFYTTNTVANKIASDTKPYIQSEVELSPMQRLIKQGSVGDGFQTDQHFKTTVYRANDATDNVRKWNVDGTSSAAYAANELSVVEGTDENNIKILVFKDKMGKIVLKRQQADETIGGTLYPWFDTYLIYDLADNLIYTVPPKAVVKLGSIGGTWNVSSVTNLVFSYTYDNKGRLTEKKLPSADKLVIVYDPLGRVVLIQSGNMRAVNTWFYSKYDAQGRVLSEGVYTDATHTTLSSMQTYVNGLACYGSSSITYYEDRTTGSAPWYTNNCFPTTGTEPRLYNYYDDYDFNNNGTPDHFYSAQGLPGETPATSKTLGLATGKMKKILGTSDWLTNISFYDKRYNLLQVQSDNQLKVGTFSDKMTNVVDFGGRLKERKAWKSPSSGPSSNTVIVTNSYSYDKLGRMLEVKQGHSGGAQVIVARYEYNAIGQLVDKKLHSTNGGASFLQSVDFRYNIRGQLISINNGSLGNDAGVTNDESNDVWGMNLLYNTTDAGISNTASYNGLLSAVKWKANIPAGNSDQRAYLFTYDKLSRLTTASYKAYNGSTWTKDAGGFNEAMTYDWNGNIMSMQRKAVISGSVADIDNLTYDYGVANDNNKLLSVTENLGTANGLNYGFRNFTAGSGYTYDLNGNLVADAKKGITITYNELNKPIRITQTSTAKYVEYGYDAEGIRISKKIYDGSTTKTINYVDGIVFDNGISHFSMPEGRVRNNSGTLVFEYFITDHQGNTRVSFEDNGSGTAVVRQENSYYPFGMLMPGNYMPTDANKKLYNAGSEWQDDFGGVIDYYSTFYREYDPVIGRFNGVDAQADVTINLSVYHYAGNDPVNYNDPMGLWRAKSVWDMNGWEGHGGWESFTWSTRLNAATFLKNLTDFLNNGGNLDHFEEMFKDGGSDVIDPMDKISRSINRLIRMGYGVTSIRFRMRDDVFGVDITFLSVGNDEILDLNCDCVVPGRTITGSVWVGLTTFEKDGLLATLTSLQKLSFVAQTSIGLTELLILEPIQNAIKYGQRITGNPSWFAKSALNATRMSKVLGGISLFFNIMDGITNPDGWSTSNSISTGATAVGIAFPAIGAIWFVGDLISQATTGKSLSDHLAPMLIRGSLEHAVHTFAPSLSPVIRFRLF